MNYLFEVAVDSLESAVIAQASGANRVELVADLGIGGITPSYGLVGIAKQQLHIPIHMMIRPRRGDFLYSEAEFEVMRRDIEYAKNVSVNGVVFGLLLPDGSIDVTRTGILTELARPLSVTFHRAFDMTADPQQALDSLMQIGIDTVLTSGQQPTAEQGLPLITELVKQAGGRIAIMPGSGINPSNIKTIAEASGATTFHFSAKKTVESDMSYRNPNLSMGGAGEGSEYQLQYADANTIREIITNATSA